MYHAFWDLDFQDFPIIFIFNPQFLLSSNFSSTFYHSLHVTLKYLSGNRFQPKKHFDLFALLSKIFYLVLVLFLSFLAFYSEITGVGTLVFSYIRRLRPFLEFKIVSFNIFGDFKKNEYFLGYDESADILWGHHKRYKKIKIFAVFIKMNIFWYNENADIFGGHHKR